MVSIVGIAGYMPSVVTSGSRAPCSESGHVRDECRNVAVFKKNGRSTQAGGWKTNTYGSSVLFTWCLKHFFL